MATINNLIVLYNTEYSKYSANAARGAELSALLSLPSLFNQAKKQLTVRLLSDIRRHIENLPKTYDRAELLKLCDVLNAELMQNNKPAVKGFEYLKDAPKQVLNQAKLKPQTDNVLQQILLYKTNKDIDKMSASGAIALIYQYRADLAVSEALGKHLENNKNFLLELAQADVNSAKKYIFGSRLGGLLTNEQTAQWLYGKRFDLNPTGMSSKIDLPSYKSNIEMVLAPCGKSINKLLEDPAAQAILMQSSIYRELKRQQDAAKLASADPNESRSPDLYQQNARDIEHEKQGQEKRVESELDQLVKSGVNLYTELNSMNNSPQLVISNSSKIQEIETAIKKAKRQVNHDHKTGKIDEKRLKTCNDLLDKAKTILLDPSIKNKYDAKMRAASSRKRM